MDFVTRQMVKLGIARAKTVLSDSEVTLFDRKLTEDEKALFVKGAKNSPKVLKQFVTIKSK